MKFSNIVISFILFLHKTKCKNLSTTTTSSDQDAQLINAVCKIIAKCSLENFSTLNFLTASKSTTLANDFISKIISQSFIERIVVVRVEHLENLAMVVNRKRKFNVILIDAAESFRAFNKSLNSSAFNFRGFFLFVLLNGRIDEIEEIFQTLWTRNIYNANVIFAENKSIDVMTFMPFSGSVCGDTTPRLVKRFNDDEKDFEDVKSIFPEKFQNLRGCTLKIVTFERQLGVIREQAPNGSRVLSGFDMTLARELGKLINFEPEIIFIDVPYPYGRIYPNGTILGALGEIVSERAHIAFGIYLQVSRNKVADSSAVYYVFPEVFAVSPGAKFGSFEKLLQPFEYIVWIILGLTLAVAVVVILTLNLKFVPARSFIFGAGIRYPLYNMLTAALGGSQKKLPQRNFSRFLLMMFVILCLVIRSAYQGALFKFLQSDDHRKDVETIDDMVEQNFEIFMYPSQIDLFDDERKKSR